jgi:hypothetical protein
MAFKKTTSWDHDPRCGLTVSWSTASYRLWRHRRPTPQDRMATGGLEGPHTGGHEGWELRGRITQQTWECNKARSRVCWLPSHDYWIIPIHHPTSLWIWYSSLRYPTLFVEYPKVRCQTEKKSKEMQWADCSRVDTSKWLGTVVVAGHCLAQDSMGKDEFTMAGFLVSFLYPYKILSYTLRWLQLRFSENRIPQNLIIDNHFSHLNVTFQWHPFILGPFIY